MINQNAIQKDEELVEVAAPMLKLDLACGDNKEKGFQGVDIMPTSSTDCVHDLRVIPWPWESDSVDEARCSHFFEHLRPDERVTFMNELFRVLKPGAGCMFITPLGHDRQVQDFTHQWPPIVMASYYYFDMEWLKENKLIHYAEQHSIECDFEVRPVQIGVSPEHVTRTDEHKAFAVRNYTNAPTDLIVVLVKKGKEEGK